MNFIEFSGRLINFDQVKVIRKTIDKSKIKETKNPETGETVYEVEGRPFEITYDYGDENVIKSTYATAEDRDFNFEQLKAILSVPKP